MNVAPEIVRNTQCDRSYACLSGGTCDVELYLDRDVRLLKCKDQRSCAYKKRYMGLFICSCPVNSASFNLN